MAGFSVSGDQYRIIDRRMTEIKRQLNLPDGSPFDPKLIMYALQGIVEGNFGSTPVPSERVVDGDAAPLCPNSWTLEEHHMSGQFEFDPTKIELYLDDAQKVGTLTGHDLRKRLVNKPVLNACVLDHLLTHTNLIPEAWKLDTKGHIQYIHFWGTVYRDSDGDFYVRYLCWCDGQWCWGFSRLNDQWDGRSSAALLAS